jgi:hypothetical protein
MLKADFIGKKMLQGGRVQDIVKIYCSVDDFFKKYAKEWDKTLLEELGRKRLRKARLSPSEIMTIVILFHSSGYRNFKQFYNECVKVRFKSEFPELVSYSRFVRLKQQILLPLCAYTKSQTGIVTGISFVDSTPIAVCKNLRINRNRVFKGLAARGKSSTGWFYGFKLHLITNDRGQILNFTITPGNINDRNPLPALAKNVFGKLFGDRGYLSQKLFEELYENGVQLITTIKRNMKNKLMPLMDKLLLRKRFIIETINDQLKNISQIEHSRHRSITNFMVNIVGGLASYCHQPKKPSISMPNLHLLIRN